MQAMFLDHVEMNKRRMANCKNLFENAINYGVEETKVDRTNYLEGKENQRTPYSQRGTKRAGWGWGGGATSLDWVLERGL